MSFFFENSVFFFCFYACINFFNTLSVIFHPRIPVRHLTKIFEFFACKCARLQILLLNSIFTWNGKNSQIIFLYNSKNTGYRTIGIIVDLKVGGFLIKKRLIVCCSVVARATLPWTPLLFWPFYWQKPIKRSKKGWEPIVKQL